MTASWIGIDFSGDHRRWRPGCRRSNVWIATLSGSIRPVVRQLHRVQALPGDAHPFERLARFLATTDYEAAGIDAPFSLPAACVEALGGHSALLDRVARLHDDGRPFPKGTTLVRALVAHLGEAKPLRETEGLWSKRHGLNVRSTLWTRARPGAPMTAACLTLLQAARKPIWPWTDRGPSLLVEAFPAAQLAHWNLIPRSYDGTRGALKRRELVESLRSRVDFGDFTEAAVESADALDSIVAAFAGIAATTGRLAEPATASGALEGWIAVHI